MKNTSIFLGNSRIGGCFNIEAIFSMFVTITIKTFILCCSQSFKLSTHNPTNFIKSYNNSRYIDSRSISLISREFVIFLFNDCILNTVKEESKMDVKTIISFYMDILKTEIFGMKVYSYKFWNSVCSEKDKYFVN